MTASDDSAHGRFRPVLSAELLQWIEHVFVETAQAEARAQARTEALAEFESAEIEIIVGDELVSRANGVEWYRVSLPRGAASTGSFEFVKPSGVRVRMERHTTGGWQAQEPGKPPVLFERTTSRSRAR